ncbi:MAG: fumarylacetoacetate hydrolase family protein [Xanthobacteraceae bacterium]|nr:fumarylacetoacetate hydrolase family protein [Xanthobacteraceae bacterium]
MKLASYIADGKACYGVVAGDGVITMNERFGGHAASLREALAGGLLPRIQEAASQAQPDRKLSDIKFLPVIPNPEKILCVGINYKSHAAEHGTEAPKLPNIFTKFVNTLEAHEGEMLRPKASTSFDFEGELALVIGKGGRHIDATDALKHVAGYTCYCDGSVRDFTKYSLVAAKNFLRSSPLGPWMVTADEIPDPTRLTLVTRLNGREMQRSGTDMLIHSIPAIIAFCSVFTPLAPGDIIATGTPDGIGAKQNPPVWMKAGDVLEIEISGIGTLRNKIVDET